MVGKPGGHAKKNRRRRNDLICKRCGRLFGGQLGLDFKCWQCKKEEKELAEDIEKAKAEEEEVDEIGTVVPNHEPEGEPPKHDPSYQKNVRTSKQLSGKRKAPLELGAAFDRAKRRGSESKEDRGRKDPLRTRLVELTCRREEVQAELVELNAEIEKCQIEVGPRDGDKLKKVCFGMYDAGGYECYSGMCPLAIECEIKSTGKVTPPEGTELGNAEEEGESPSETGIEEVDVEAATG